MYADCVHPKSSDVSIRCAKIPAVSENYFAVIRGLGQITVAQPAAIPPVQAPLAGVSDGENTCEG